MIGYILAQELRNARPERPVAALLTQTLVDADDPAFQHPTKPIGPVYTPDHPTDARDSRRLRPSHGAARSPEPE
jgi:carbamate kinase